MNVLRLRDDLDGIARAGRRFVESHDPADLDAYAARLARLRDALPDFGPVPAPPWPESLAGGLRFTGLAAPWSPAPDGDQREPGAFAESLPVYLDAGGALTYRHNPARPLGRVLAAYEADDGLRVAGLIFPPSEPWQRVIRDAVRAGLLVGLSWAGHRAKDGRAVVLGEVTITPTPAHPGAMIETVEEL